MRTSIKPEIPKVLSDFDQSMAINHPSLTQSRQFVVTDDVYGKGIWSATLSQPILPINTDNKAWSFEAVQSSTPTSRIFWQSRNRQHKKLYIAESETVCAVEIEIPDNHRFGFALSGSVMFLENEQVNPNHKYCLYSINTKSFIHLEVDRNSYLDTVYVLENKNQVMLIFCPNAGYGPTSSGIFIVDITKFKVERVPSKE